MHTHLMSCSPLLLITSVSEAGTMPGLYRKHLPKLNLVKENSRVGATALPLMAQVNVGPCFI